MQKHLFVESTCCLREGLTPWVQGSSKLFQKLTNPGLGQRFLQSSGVAFFTETSQPDALHETVL